MSNLSRHAGPAKDARGYARMRRIPLSVGIALALLSPAYAQTCPTPVVVNDTTCTVAEGTTITVATANAVGVSASGPTAQVTADAVSVRLGAAGATAVFSQLGAEVFFRRSAVAITSVGAAANGQFGLRANGGGGLISAVGTDIALSPLSGTTNNMRGVSAEGGSVISLNDTAVTVRGGANGTGNYGVQAVGPGSLVSISGGTVDTSSRGAFAVLAQDAGKVDLLNTQVTSAGAQVVATNSGSHALVSTGGGSQVNATNITASTSGTLGNAARAEAGGALTLVGSQLRSTGAGSALASSAGIRVLSGGSLNLGGTGSAVTATGLWGNGLQVEDPGSTATVSDTAIRVEAGRAMGVLIRNGGSADIRNSTVVNAGVTAGPWAPAVQVEGAGSKLVMTGSQVTTVQQTSYGIRALVGADIDVSNTSITTSGAYSAALSGGSSTITATDITIVTTGDNNAMGVLSDGNGVVTLVRGTIDTSGDSVAQASFPHALGARNPGGVLNADGTIARTRGYIAMGAWADDGGTANIANVRITTEGERAIGAFAIVEQQGDQFPASLTANTSTIETFGPNAHGAAAQARNDLPGRTATATANDSAITTHGAGAQGLRAVLANYGSTPTGRGAAVVVANRSTVVTEGESAHGALSKDAPTSVTMNQTSVRTSGAAAHGAVAAIGGRIVGNDADVAVSGASAMGLFVLGEPGAVSGADFTGSSLTNVSGPNVGVAGNGVIALADSTVAGSGEWLRVGTIEDFPPPLTSDLPEVGPSDLPDEEGIPPVTAPPPLAAPPFVVTPGLADITATRSTMTGSAFTAAGSVSNLTLVDTTWLMTGSSNLTNLVNDPSLIDFSAPVGGAFKTLTVANYSGDGTIALNTFLGDDSSPSDLLVVDGGSASGASRVQIKQAGGAGAVTVANGILVVDAVNGATTTPTAFALAAPVFAGPYEYTLQRSSRDATGPEDWFLRSTIDCAAADAPSPPCPEPPPPPPPPPTPPPDPPTPPTPPPPTPRVLPNVRAEVSLYAALAPTALNYGRALLDTLHERVGEQELLWGRSDLDDQRSRVDGMWGRLMYVNGDRDGSDNGILGRGPSYDFVAGAVQIGYDLYRHEEPDEHRDHAGLYGAVGYAETEVDHFDGRNAGDERIDGYTLGGYWTRYGRKQWYIDSVLQATWYEASANPRPERGFNRMRTDGLGLAASIEGGYPFRNKHDWVLEPQGQLIYQWIELDDSSDLAADVQFDDVDSLVGRLSARLSRDWVHEDSSAPLSSTGWGRVSVWHEFRGDPITRFSSQAGFVPFHADLGGTWWELELGLTREIDRNVFFYGNAGYAQGFDDDRHSWEGKFGLRANW